MKTTLHTDWTVGDICKGFIYDKNEFNLSQNVFYELGCYYLQEPSAMMVSHLLNPTSEDVVLDYCSAPGGKMIQSSFLMNDEGLIIANDLSYPRQQITLENIEKLGISNVILVCGDLSKTDHLYSEKFDKIILDAPCSGSGMFRKSEAMKEDWTYQKVLKCAEIQKSLILSAYKMLKKGGTLIYSTCSFSYEEDEEIAQYLLDNTDAKVIEIENDPKFYQSSNRLGIHLFPHLFPGEGHYICIFKKPGQISNHHVYKRKDFVFDDKLYQGFFDFQIRNLKIIRNGIKIKDGKASYLIPDLHYARTLQSYEQEYQLNLEQMKKYLLGEPIAAHLDKGIYLLKYQDLPLDFAKSDGEMIKNHYPKKYRKKY